MTPGRTSAASRRAGSRSSSGTTIADLRPAHRFLQVLVLPYASSGMHSCFVTVRDVADGPAFGQSGFSPFNFACELTPPEQVAFVAGIILTLALAAAPLAAIPIIGPILAAADLLAIATLMPLLNPGTTIGDYLATAMNLATQVGMFGIAEEIVDSILGSFMSVGSRQDLSFNIMDGYDYSSRCYKALSLEVAFNADETEYVDYVNEVLAMIDSLATQNVLVGAYISLRFCGQSAALLAIEQWPNTVCIEISSLAGLAGDEQALIQFEQAAAQRGATVHWGQLNHRSRADVERVFPRIDTWRTVLARLSSAGAPGTFDNEFCLNHGLETFGATWKPPAMPFLASLTQTASGAQAALSAAASILLDDESRPSDLGYLEPLLLDRDDRQTAAATVSPALDARPLDLSPQAVLLL